MNLNIYQKLHQIQSKLNHLTKTETNQFQKYKYATEYQILKVLKPLLSENKLTLTFSDEITPTRIAENNISYDDENLTNLVFQKQDKEWVVKYLKKAVLINLEKPEEQLTLHFWATGQNTDIAKAKGSAETYAIKYFLQKLFLIPTSDNLDPDRRLDNFDKLSDRLDKREVVASRELTEQEKKTVEEFLNKHNYGAK